MGIVTRVTYGLRGAEHPSEILIDVDDLEFLAANVQERLSVTRAIFYMKPLCLQFKIVKI